MLPVIDANLKCEKDQEHTYVVPKYEMHHAYDEKLVVKKDDMPQVQPFQSLQKAQQIEERAKILSQT